MMDKYIIKAYKHMLIDCLRGDTFKWKCYTKCSYSIIRKTDHYYKISVTSSIIFEICENKVDIISNGLSLYTFKNLLFKDIRLLFKIRKFRKRKANEEKDQEYKNKERILENGLPDKYKRSIKLSKIKNKI